MGVFALQKKQTEIQSNSQHKFFKKYFEYTFVIFRSIWT